MIFIVSRMICKEQSLLKVVVVFSNLIRSSYIFIIDLNNKKFGNLKKLFILDISSLIFSVEDVLIKYEVIESFFFNYFSFIKFMLLFEVKSSEGVKYILILVGIFELNIDFFFEKYLIYYVIEKKIEINKDILNGNLENYSFGFNDCDILQGELKCNCVKEIVEFCVMFIDDMNNGKI